MATGSGEHIVKSFDEELEHLSHVIMRMGGLAETALARATEAFGKRDAELAAAIVQGDSELDELEQEVSELAIQMLARRQPMANDLREVISALKISNTIERIGDHSANVAKRTIALTQLPAVEPMHSITRMARLVQDNIHRVLDAYVAADADSALDVWTGDEEVDEMYSSLFRETLTYMMEDPRNITPCTHLLFIAKNIERIGDHATNIAEVVHFLVRGTRIEGGRPKGDTSSYTIGPNAVPAQEAQPGGRA